MTVLGKACNTPVTFKTLRPCKYESHLNDFQGSCQRSPIARGIQKTDLGVDNFSEGTKYFTVWTPNFWALGFVGSLEFTLDNSLDLLYLIF